MVCLGFVEVDSVELHFVHRKSNFDHHQIHTGYNPKIAVGFPAPLFQNFSMVSAKKGTTIYNHQKKSGCIFTCLKPEDGTLKPVNHLAILSGIVFCLGGFT